MFFVHFKKENMIKNTDFVNLNFAFFGIYKLIKNKLKNSKLKIKMSFFNC